MSEDNPEDCVYELLVQNMWPRSPLGRPILGTGTTIGAVVRELGDGYSKVTLADRRAVRNHLSCVHAVALANLVELTGNMALAYSLPDDARFIVAGMRLDYVKKARGTITG